MRGLQERDSNHEQQVMTHEFNEAEKLVSKDLKTTVQEKMTGSSLLLSLTFY